MATAWLWRWWWLGCCCFPPLFAVAGQGSHPQDGLPRPWLTVDRSAKLLTLSCKPPPAAKHWSEVHALRLVAFLPAVNPVSNTTVAVITSAMKTPRPGPDLPPVARVHFSGEWGDKTPLLQVTTPLTPRLYGTFYCVVAYSPRQELSPAANFSTQVSVDAHGPRVSMDTHRPDPHGHALKHNFRVSVKDVHEVKVTWRDVTGSRFVEASLTRVTEDREGGAVTAPRTLLTATGGTAAAPSEKFVFGGSGVELSAFSAPRNKSDNYSMTAYVGADACSPYCSYACSVPYPGCVGLDHLQFCVYPPQQLTHLPPSSTNTMNATILPTAEEEDVGSAVGSAVGWMVAFIVLLVLCVVFGLWMVFRRRKRLQKEVQQIGGSGEDQEEVYCCWKRPADEVTNGSPNGSPPPEVGNQIGGAADQAEHQRPTEADARSGCKDKGMNRTTGRPAGADANNGGAIPKRKPSEQPPPCLKDLPTNCREDDDMSMHSRDHRDEERAYQGAPLGGNRRENGEELQTERRQDRGNLSDDVDGMSPLLNLGHRRPDSDSYRHDFSGRSSGLATSANRVDEGAANGEDENSPPEHEELKRLLGTSANRPIIVSPKVVNIVVHPGADSKGPTSV